MTTATAIDTRQEAPDADHADRVLLFVVLLLPGFAYQVGKERRGIERTTSVLRETAAVVAASVASEIFVLAATSLAVVAAHRLRATCPGAAQVLDQPPGHHRVVGDRTPSRGDRGGVSGHAATRMGDPWLGAPGR
jgi:hypothetical protein